MNANTLPRPNLVDRLVGIVSPRAALDRIRFRAALRYYDQVSIGSGYVTGGSGKRSMRGWRPGAHSANEDTVPKLESARASSRDLYMNTPVATGLLRRIKTNAVGHGLKLQAHVDRRKLGLTEAQASEWEARTQREFHMWARSKDSDATRKSTFYQLQVLAFLSVLMNGDAFVLLPHVDRRNRSKVPYRLALRLVEADQVDTPPSQESNPNVTAGIETDNAGDVIAYHVCRSLEKIDKWDPNVWTRISAYGARSGRRNVLHLVERERVGQLRGMPSLAPIFEPIKQLTRLSEAELNAAVINAFFTVFVKSTPGALAPGYAASESLLTDPDGTSGRSATHPDNNVYELGSGSIVELDDNQEIQLADPKRPNDSFDAFSQAILRQIGASAEVPYEQLMLAFTSSYSASRAALLEAWKFYRARRTWWANEFCQPVYEEWLTEAILRGRIEAPGFFDDWGIREAWVGATWVGPSQGQLDPVKETQAAKERIDARLSNHNIEYTAIHGDDWDGAMDSLAGENRSLKARGLMPTAQDSAASAPDDGGENDDDADRGDEDTERQDNQRRLGEEEEDG